LFKRISIYSPPIGEWNAYLSHEDINNLCKLLLKINRICKKHLIKGHQLVCTHPRSTVHIQSITNVSLIDVAGRYHCVVPA
jgi:hypothetical protein